jgi:hypothetical protein
VQGARLRGCCRMGAGVVMLRGVVILLLTLLLLLRCGDGGSGEPEAARVCGCGCGSLYGVLGLERLGAAVMPRRSCHGHAARIRRLRRGIRVCGAGGRGAGGKGARAGGYGGLSRSGAAELAGDASGSRGVGAKGERRLRLVVAERGGGAGR